MTDRPFVLVIFSSANMEELHKMLVVEDPFSKEFDRKDEAWELHHLTAASTSFFFSYLLRTLASLASSLVPFIILIFSWDDFQSDRLFCQVCHISYDFSWAGPRCTRGGTSAPATQSTSTKSSWSSSSSCSASISFSMSTTFSGSSSPPSQGWGGSWQFISPTVGSLDSSMTFTTRAGIRDCCLTSSVPVQVLHSHFALLPYLNPLSTSPSCPPSNPAKKRDWYKPEFPSHPFLTICWNHRQRPSPSWPRWISFTKMWQQRVVFRHQNRWFFTS